MSLVKYKRWGKGSLYREQLAGTGEQNFMGPIAELEAGVCI
jgi:hypothetical protein